MREYVGGLFPYHFPRGAITHADNVQASVQLVMLSAINVINCFGGL